MSSTVNRAFGGYMGNNEIQLLNESEPNSMAENLTTQELSNAIEIEGRSLSKKPKITDRFNVSCTEFKQVIIEGPSFKYDLDFDVTCFSISKLPHCRPGCTEQRNVKVKYRFACIDTNASFSSSSNSNENQAAAEAEVNEISNKIRDGIFVDLSRKPLRKLKIKYPSGCY